ncbi:putative modulator of DNA gyrase; TldD [Synechococcus sp. WH 7805]|uniref:TldD/PmbA family protein n=1 Tax=Synechococcus sp. (strain WH7805) TaxID=59931 RepID=UPI00006B0C2B|nr:TldD/PmbA family protein [Synechococcus sp. WH 7805]EAR18871.1 putative modulator of DNA gyrase; TldD [Synechococcus sp. WH 7805]
MQTTTISTTGIFNLDPGCSPWEQRLNTLLSVGLAAGADLVEVFLERTDHLGVLAEQDKITSVSPAFGMGAGIRVFRGARDGFVSTNDLSDAGLTEALEQALAMLQLERSTLSGSNSFQGLSALRNFAATKNDWLERTPNLDVITQRLLEGTQCLQRLGQHLEVRRGNFSRDWQEVLVAASDGTFARDIRLHQSSGLSVLAADGDHRASIARRYGTTDKPNDLCDWNIEASAQEVCASASTMLRADYVDGGQMPVVLANRFGGVIFHEACGHLLETTQIERGTTPFAESIGESIAHPAVTAIDEGLSDGAFGSMSMDDEGMEPQRTVLIEKGVLKRFISDRAGELRTGHARTGSGRRQSHGFAAASRMRNTYIAAGPHSIDDLIGSVDRGLYCKSMGGGSVGPTGQFNFSVEEGYLIENGTLSKPVKGATLIGEAKEVMPRISMCADDLDLAAGYCGSVSGSVFVTVGQPHVKVDSITVGGR